MKNLGRLLRASVVVLTCWGLLLAPYQARAGVVVRMEVDDAEKFRTDMRQFLTGQGLDSFQMKEFLRAPKREWNAILDRFNDQFGFSPRLIDALSTGEVTLAVHTDGAVLGARHEKAALVAPFVPQLAKLFEGFPHLNAEAMSAGGRSRVLVPGPTGTVLVESAGTRLVIAAGEDQATVQSRASEFMDGKMQRLADRKDLPAELRGPGLIVMQAAPGLPGGGPIPGAPQLPPQIQEMFGLSTPSFTRVYFKGGDMRISQYVPSRKPIFYALYLPGPVSKSALSWLPTESEAATGLHVQVSQLIPMILEMDKTGEMGIAPMLEQLKAMMGMQFQDELLAHVGDEIVIGQLPMKRGGGFPLFSAIGLGSTYAVISLKDAAAFDAGLQKLLVFLGNMASMDTVGGGVKETVVGGTPVRYIRLGAGVISPCFAIKGDDLVVTSNVPLMRYLLRGHGTWNSITTDGDFQANLALLGGELKSSFSYSRYHASEAGAGNVQGTLISVAIISILSAMLLPALGKARARARSVSNMSDLKQIGLAAMTFHMDHDRLPKDLSELEPDYLGAGFIDGVSEVIHYCPVEGVDIPADRPLAYSRVAQGRDGLNILFGDGHVAFHPAGSMEHAAAMALESVPSRKAGEVPAVPEGLLHPDKLKQFMMTEARNLGKTIDFALFPSLAEFSREGSSNISLLEVTEEGLLSTSKVGHLFPGGM